MEEEEEEDDDYDYTGHEDDEIGGIACGCADGGCTGCVPTASPTGTRPRKQPQPKARPVSSWAL